jgi:hypothetical protein
MCTVSFDKALNITICNQYSGLELISPLYCSMNTTCYVSPSQQADTGNAMKVDFGIDIKQKDVKCALLYKLQRKCTGETNNQTDSIASIKHTATNRHLLVVWAVEDSYNRFYACLIEYADDFIWDKDKLWALYREYNDQFCKDYKSDIITWLMHDGTVMKMKLDVTYGSYYKLDIIISEGSWEHDMERPVEIDLKRLVLSLPMLTVLIYAARLTSWPSFKLNVHNQCSNIDLVSPMYATGDELECCRAPDHHVYTGNTMKSVFIINEPDKKSSGALIYKLQKKQTHQSAEIGEDTSSAAHLLVVWEISASKELYADVLLVEHDKQFDWDKNNLEELRRKNINRFRLCHDATKEIWSLDDNTALMITFKIINEGLMLYIIVTEVEGYNYARMLVQIDLKR